MYYAFVLVPFEIGWPEIIAQIIKFYVLHTLQFEVVSAKVKMSLIYLQIIKIVLEKVETVLTIMFNKYI